jgi:hypothetical protein
MGRRALPARVRDLEPCGRHRATDRQEDWAPAVLCRRALPPLNENYLSGALHRAGCVFLKTFDESATEGLFLHPERQYSVYSRSAIPYCLWEVAGQKNAWCRNCVAPGALDVG